MDKCVGAMRISFGEWYCPKGQTPQQCTYCAYCVNNGCIGINDVDRVEVAINSCNCDCPNQKDHPKLQPVVCDDCVPKLGGFMTCDCGDCNHCGGFTPTGCQQCCDGCSILLNVCIFCDKSV